MKLNRQILIFIMLVFKNFIFAVTLDFDTFNGTGKFINAKGGTISSPNNTPYDDVIGTAYVSGDFGENNYSDTLNTNTVFSALDFNGTVISESPLYNAAIESNPATNEYYFVLTRNKFDEGVIEDKELGRILELGYFDSNSGLKDRFYNGIKNFYSGEDLNLAVNETFGLHFLPLIAKQSLEIISDSGSLVADSVFSIDEHFPTGRWKALGFYNYNRLKVDNSDDYESYRIRSNITSFGAENKIKSYLKVGIIGTFIDSTTDLDDYRGSRDDLFYIGRVYAVYDTDSVIYSTMLSAGGSDTDIYRYNYSPLGDYRNTTDMTNLFLSLNNSVYSKIVLGKSYITPKAELNFIGLRQGEIDEDGDYGLEVDDVTTLSIKPGIGFNLGRTFDITDNTKFNLEGEVMNYFEVGDPYGDLDVRLDAVSSEKGSIDGYDENSYYLELSLSQNLRSLNGLSFSLNENWVFHEEQDKFRFQLELKLVYVF